MKNIKEKIQKLLLLGKSPNEHEAALALHKAHELLEKYNLTLDEVYFSEDNLLDNTVMAGRRIPTWINWLAGTISTTFDVGVYYNLTEAGGRRLLRNLQFVGFEADVMVAQHCFFFLKRAIENGCRARMRRLREDGHGIPRGFRNAYALGFLEAVKEKMAALARKRGLEPEAPPGVNLPVLKAKAVERYLARLNLKKGRKSNPTMSYAGYLAGALDGERTQVSRPVNGCGSPTAIA